MAAEYINRKGQKYYLHQGTTKTGKTIYLFSIKSEGNLVKNIQIFVSNKNIITYLDFQSNQ